MPFLADSLLSDISSLSHSAVLASKGSLAAAHTCLVGVAGLGSSGSSGICMRCTLPGPVVFLPDLPKEQRVVSGASM